MSVEKFAQQLRLAFKQALQEKTGWGRNEILKKFDESMIEVLIKGVAEDKELPSSTKEVDFPF